MNFALQQQLAHDYALMETKIQQLMWNLSNTTADRIFEMETNISLLNQYLQDISAAENRREQVAIQQSENITALVYLLSGSDITLPASSCASLPPSSPSGYYWVRDRNGSAVHVYCDMTRSCGGLTGGWMRVAKLDMTNSSHQCPSGFLLRTDSSIRTCIRDSNSPGCSSITISTSNTASFTNVCGKVIAYQRGAPDAFYRFSYHGSNINSFYVDGVSLTHGTPRRHIWTFAAAVDELYSGGPLTNCPCIRSDQVGSNSIPSFVGDEYFCDTASQDRFISGHFYDLDPLWDGTGCGPLNTCCRFNNPPWFHKLLQPTTDDIEMRVCRSAEPSNEDIAVEMIDIYIQSTISFLTDCILV